MTIYIIITTYSDFGFFGTYSTMLRARKALENYLKEATDIISFKDFEDSYYEFVTTRGETFSVEIVADILDYEYETGELKDGN